MDDEEDEQLPRCCETPLRNKRSEKRDAHGGDVGQTAHRHASTQTAGSVLNSARDADMAPFQGSQREASSLCRVVGARTAFRAPCGTGGLVSLTMGPGARGGPRALFHGNAGFRAHFPALFEPALDGLQNAEQREQDEGRPEEKEEDRDAGISVEVQIGRKLREMGDQFQQEHLQLVRVIHIRLILFFKAAGFQMCVVRNWWFQSRCKMTSLSAISVLNMQIPKRER
ncbi:BCL2 modifying factor 2 isoform X1 [Danio rerio]|uniref:BCL2 modifying factor 2 isoform X1 n=1 Tax=Danio rerio TaxID=7955 RepID=Q0GKC4_DANRE|nr:BCL2 modifying factor 2 [Danio rerio]XP_009293242.1 bmf2 isoform X1 [Danio rerio]ABI18127.1 Bmf2 [Danio rerio]|eukprot:NP_001038938.1 Bmf2 [Danio rerio]